MRLRVLSTFAVNTPLARLGARSCELVDAASSVVDKLGVTGLYARVGGVERSGEFLLMELELIEPVLFFGLGRRCRETCAAIAAAVEPEAETRAICS